MTARGGIAGAISLALLASCSAGYEIDEHTHPALDDLEPVPLYDDLGDYRREITTDSEEARAYFDQGLRLQYAFNHTEAIKSYEIALGHDPECAMCWWGVALALGPNINAAMDAENDARAYAAVEEARAHADGASEPERGLIAALAGRYAADTSADRAPLDSAYAGMMDALSTRLYDDPDVLALAGAAAMNLSPWDYWTGPYGDRTPRSGTERILELLEAALAVEPDHPGACHYYIHAVEAAYPERAVPCAERLAGLMPGAGHIVHMPGHIYIRVGRYADAVAANEHAVHSDETYIRDRSPTGVYPSAYYPHNYHFMAFAAAMAGMSATAFDASETVAPKIPKEVALEVSWIQNAIVLPQLTAVTFGEWDRVLAAPLPDPELGQATALAHYARGVAHAALGDPASARASARELDGVAAALDPGGENPVLEIARHALAGEIALRSGDAASAVTRFRAAAGIEDGMLYEEPPLWYYPVRHSLGRALLEAGRPADAEAAYREDLARFPANGWSLFGLARSLEAQGKDASEVRAAFAEAWRNADVALFASRF